MTRLYSTLALLALFGGLGMLPAQAYEEAPVEGGGAISGRVGFEGEDPAPHVYAITKDNEVCGTGNVELDFVKVNDGGLADAVVYLKKVEAGKPFPPLATEVAQNRCVFEPFLTIMHNENNLVAINNDLVLHNVHTYELFGRVRKTVFNISQPNISRTEKPIKLRRGPAMKVECDAHDFMHSFVFVARNPYYARVDDNGEFSIDNIPPGEYTLQSWHGTLGEQKTTVKVLANGSTAANFLYAP